MGVQIQSVARAAQILEQLAKPPGRFSLADLAERLDLPRTTVHGLIRTLYDHGLVHQDRDTDRYLLGPALLHLGTRYVLHADLRLRCQPWVDWLSARTGLAGELAIPFRPTSVIVILYAPEPDKPAHATTVGTELPLTRSGLGRAMLAYQPSAAGTPSAGTPGSTIPAGELAQAIRGVRRRRVATDLDSERSGRVGLAAPVFGPHGQPVAAIGVLGSFNPDTRQRMTQATEQVKEAARGASRDLGAANWPPA